MPITELELKQQKQTLEFMAKVLGTSQAQVKGPGRPPALKFSAGTPPRNEPEFWADMPWRVEPDGEALPLSFVIRDANVQPPGRGPWRLHELRVEQRRRNGTWHPVCTLRPADLPDMDAQGNVRVGFWTHRIDVPLRPSASPYRLALDEVPPGSRLHLRVVFAGSFGPLNETAAPEVHLETYRAEQPLPAGRGASGPRQWFYGDTHYHSAYTNDIKEFGGIVADTRAAGRCIGLDWLIVTDHSCDLDETDDDPQHRTRWQRLRDELARPDVSNGEFRVLLGEEVTLRGGEGQRYVHMLAFGTLHELIHGGFLPDDPDSFVTGFFKTALEKTFQVFADKGGYPHDTAARLFGPVQLFDDVMRALPEGTLSFAAHPFTVAQPPFVDCTWDQKDLDDPRLTGLEFWNGRARRGTLPDLADVPAHLLDEFLTNGALHGALLTTDPFSKPAWNDKEKVEAADRKRINKLIKHARQDWDPALVAGVKEWPAGRELPERRPVLIAGSDAHGSFNYSVGWGWNYRQNLLVEDNALGRARTAVYLPEHAAAAVPEPDEIVAALHRGSAVVTDGPVLEFCVEQDGHTARMGEALAARGGVVNMTIVAHTTPEFGRVDEVTLVSYFDGQSNDNPRRRTIKAGVPRTLTLQGKQGFCRLQAETQASDGERFCCLTNPIWIRAAEGERLRLRVQLVG